MLSAIGVMVTLWWLLTFAVNTLLVGAVVVFAIAKHIKDRQVA